jgi:hypothetical protein
MTIGWLVPLFPLAIMQWTSFQNLHDVWVMAVWTGLFVGAGWLLFAFPLVRIAGDSFIVADIRVSWLSWAILGLVAYCILTLPLFGADMIALLWYPAIVGCVAGFAYSLLIKNEK